MLRRLLPTLAGLGALACADAHNYVDPAGPRYAGRVTPSGPPAPARLCFVTFNIRFSREIDRAIDLFRTAPPLREADVIALQEMDEPGTRRLAAALHFNYVYYPAVVHPQHGRDFGNALLARWPIEDDGKLILPHRSRLNGLQRVAVAGTIALGGHPVRFYSVHLSTPLEVGTSAQGDQAAAVVADGRRFERVVVAGDMNGRSIGSRFEEHGLRWLTRNERGTLGLLAWDHVFTRGLVARGGGVVPDNLGASDHRAVWAVLELE